VRPEHVDVTGLDLGGRMGELDGEVAEGALARGEPRPAVVVLRMSRQLLVCALCPEVVCVRARSVMAALLSGRDRREQFALTA
jgi:hypothetical protein